MDNMGSTLFYIVMMVAVLVGAYVLTKYFIQETETSGEKPVYLHA